MFIYTHKKGTDFLVTRKINLFAFLEAANSFTYVIHLEDMNSYPPQLVSVVIVM
jgi:hypothetical protein